MPARDYFVAPVIRSDDLTNYSQVSDSSDARRLRYQGQTDVDPERRLPPTSACYELSDRSKPSVSSF